jgi:hypothetical protein
MSSIRRAGKGSPPLTRFVGREAELSEATALLAEARLLTLTWLIFRPDTRLISRRSARLNVGLRAGTYN